MKIIIGKLITGEVIVGEENDNIIKKCLTLRPVQSPSNQIATHILPLLHPISDEFIDINKEHIVYFGKVNKELEEEYRKITSNIVVASSLDLNNIKNIKDFSKRK